MHELTANTTEAALEKHLPAVTVNGGKIEVVVGAVEHPMSDAHYIEWILLETDKGVQIRHPDSDRCAEGGLRDRRRQAVSGL